MKCRLSSSGRSEQEAVWKRLEESYYILYIKEIHRGHTTAGHGMCVEIYSDGYQWRMAADKKASGL